MTPPSIDVKMPVVQGYGPIVSPFQLSMVPVSVGVSSVIVPSFCSVSVSGLATSSCVDSDSKGAGGAGVGVLGGSSSSLT